MTPLTMVIITAMVMTVAVLLMGLGSMAHGGEFDEKHSSQFMMARVVLQAITLMLLVAAFSWRTTNTEMIVAPDPEIDREVFFGA